MKTYASSLVLLVLALGIGVYLWRERSTPALTPGSVALLRTDPQAVRQVELAVGERKLTLRRSTSGGQWRVLSGGKNAPAEPNRVRDLLQSLQLVQASTSHGLTRERDYGLVPPRATLTLTSGQGRTRLEFGNLSPVARDQVYARANGVVGLVSTAPLQRALGDLEAWRDRAILRFEPQSVTRFVVKKAATLTLQKQGSGSRAFWQIVAPLQARADGSNSETFLRTLASALFVGSDTVTLPPSAASVGEVSVQTPAGRQTLSVYALSGARTTAPWVGRNTAGSTFVLPPSIGALLDRPLLAWREKSVLPFRIGDIERIQIAYQGTTQLWQRNGATWFTGRGDSATEVGSTVRDTLLETLLATQNLRATRFELLAAVQKRGLTPAVELRLNDQIVRVGRAGGDLWATSSAFPDAAQLAPADFAAFQSTLGRLFPAPPSPQSHSTKRTKDTP